MLARWYLCPYDIVDGPMGQKGRSCAMRRHIPRVAGDGGGARWDEAEALGNTALVLVTAPAALHAAIARDRDFVRIDHPLSARTRARLVAAGYTTSELDAATSLDTLTDRIAARRNRVTVTSKGVLTVHPDIKGPSRPAGSIRDAARRRAVPRAEVP